MWFSKDAKESSPIMTCFGHELLQISLLTFWPHYSPLMLINWLIKVPLILILNTNYTNCSNETNFAPTLLKPRIWRSERIKRIPRRLFFSSTLRLFVSSSLCLFDSSTLCLFDFLWTRIGAWFVLDICKKVIRGRRGDSFFLGVVIFFLGVVGVRCCCEQVFVAAANGCSLVLRTLTEVKEDRENARTKNHQPSHFNIVSFFHLHKT